MATENKTLDANISVSGYKPVAIIAATFVGAYAVKKLVDKWTRTATSVSINAEAKSDGK